MTEKLLTNIDESNIEWKEFITKQGKKFEIGYLDTDEKTSTTIKTSSKKPFQINVDWEVRKIKKWINTTPDVKTASAISKYALYNQHGITYKYRLEFVNSKHYDYHFTDASGDTYSCNTFRNGTHFIRYNSSAPNIVTIEGN
ncbi:hypothetical protein [Tenacibaculum aiptasiae]|uniref:hypothetical protein n=1 Tax=Tenacibaculum aiptasiae TaxID=426481 RepID=UPI003B59D859